MQNMRPEMTCIRSTASAGHKKQMGDPFPVKQSDFLLDNHTVYHIVCVTHCMKNSTELDVDLFENLKLELRRGCLIVAVLAQLRQEHYGYTLRKALDNLGLAIDEGTLYPLLRRLETQGLLASEWREEDKREKRFYRLSPAGDRVVRQLDAEWRGLNASIARILEDE